MAPKKSKPIFKSKDTVPSPPSFPTLPSEASLQPRIISTITESDEYEELDLDLLA